MEIATKCEVKDRLIGRGAEIMRNCSNLKFAIAFPLILSIFKHIILKGQDENNRFV